VPEDDVAGLGDMLVELQADLGIAQQPRQLTLAGLDRLAAQMQAVISAPSS
jgi:hypothetical protein